MRTLQERKQIKFGYKNKGKNLKSNNNEENNVLKQGETTDFKGNKLKYQYVNADKLQKQQQPQVVYEGVNDFDAKKHKSMLSPNTKELKAKLKQ